LAFREKNCAGASPLASIEEQGREFGVRPGIFLEKKVEVRGLSRTIRLESKSRLLGRFFMPDQKNINHVAEKLLDRRRVLLDRIRTGNIGAAEVRGDKKWIPLHLFCNR
jgi:hypothetical protein